MSFTPAHSRAARALLGWSQAQLADVSKVATKTIADFERGDRSPYDRTLADIQEAFELARIEFTNGGSPGVRVRGDKTFGHVFDEKGHVGVIKDGEFRVGRDKRLVAVVREGELHDPQTGEFLGRLADLGNGPGQALPPEIRQRLPNPPA